MAELNASGTQDDLSNAGGGSGGFDPHYVTLDDVAPFKHMRRKISNESSISNWVTDER
jgi:hypothetical protein